MGKYEDIINLPHHVSKKHPQMSMHDRAAQFAPFAALSGHSEAIEETARLADRKIGADKGTVLCPDKSGQRTVPLVRLLMSAH